MELAVLSHRGIPGAGVISVRSGHTRRQVQLDALDGRTLQFPCEPGHNTTFKVDVFEEVGHARFAFDPAVRKYCLPLDAAPHGGRGALLDMEVTFSVQPASAAGDAASGSPPPGGDDDDDHHHPRHPAGEGGREAAAREYLEGHGIMAFMQFLMQGLMRERPPDPYTFLQKQVTTRMVSELMKDAVGGDAELLDGAELRARTMTPEQRRRLAEAAARSSEQMRADNERLRETAEQLKARYAALVEQNSALGVLPEPPLQPPGPPPEIKAPVHGGDDADAGGSGGEEWEGGADAKAAAPCDAAPPAAQAEPPPLPEPQVPAEHRGQVGDEEEEEVDAKAAAPCEPPAPPAAQAEPPPALEPRAPVECKGRAGDDDEKEDDEEEADAKAVAPCMPPRAGDDDEKEEEEEVDAKAVAPCDPPAPPAAQAEPPPAPEPRAPGDDEEREDGEEEVDAKAAVPAEAAAPARPLGTDMGQGGGHGLPVTPPSARAPEEPQLREGEGELAAEVDFGPLPPPSENEPPELAAKREVLEMQREIKALGAENTALVSELSRIRSSIDTLQGEAAEHRRGAPPAAVS